MLTEPFDALPAVLAHTSARVLAASSRAADGTVTDVVGSGSYRADRDRSGAGRIAARAPPLDRRVEQSERTETRRLLELLEQLTRPANALAVLRETQAQTAQARAAQQVAEQLFAVQQRRAATATEAVAPLQGPAPTVTQHLPYRPAAMPRTPHSSAQ